MTTAGDHRYEAEIRWTTHGVPHITAADLGSLAFGQGWACARDHLPTIADQVLKVRSERSRFLGGGPADLHLRTDLGYLALGVRERAERMATTQSPDVLTVVEGYAAGINAWLAEHGTDALPEWCRGAPWVRPVSPVDLYSLYVDLTIIASGRNLAAYIGSATPPGAEHPEPHPIELPHLDPGLSSNGWALGRAATANGRGMVMANPHFPWFGEARFWECHLRLPGDLDVYGVSLIGTPGVQIGFTRSVGWTHTFSRGHRFCVAKLDLASSPTRYRFGDEEREMTPTEHRVAVLGDDGGHHEVVRTLYTSHHGPILDFPMIGWSDAMVLTYRDANLDNDRMLAQFLAMDRAQSVADLQAAIEEHQGLPWVNTMAADDTGRCWYIDASTTPNLSPEAEEQFLANLESDPFTQLAFGLRVALLDGSDPVFEWVDEPGARSPGIVPLERLPRLERDDHVFNANDPYWLANATEFGDEGPVLCGLYQRPVSPRTRTNATFLAGEGPVLPSGPGGTFTVDDLVAAVLGNHSLLATQLKDEIVTRCRAVGTVTAEGREVELGGACDLLDAWDGRFELDSVGAVIWRELLGSFTDTDLHDAGPLWAEAWDPTDPFRTPRGLAPAPPEGPDPVAVALARGLLALEKAGVAPDARLGEVQFIERSGRRIPMHGANEVEGMLNVVAPVGALTRSDLEPLGPEPTPVAGRTERTGLHVGGYPITYGVSFLMFLTFTDDGPEARGLLAYGQSGHPGSPHHVDQTEAFSRKELRPLRFTDDQIAADPELRTTTVRG